MPGIRGRLTGDDQPVDPRAVAKTALVQFAALERELSWSVGKFSGRERWALKWYDLVDSKYFPGALVVTDRDTDADIMIYAKAGVDWHSVCLEYYHNGEWHIFRPQNALAEWRSGSPNWANVPGMPETVNW